MRAHGSVLAQKSGPEPWVLVLPDPVQIAAGNEHDTTVHTETLPRNEFLSTKQSTDGEQRLTRSNTFRRPSESPTRRYRSSSASVWLKSCERRRSSACCWLTRAASSFRLRASTSCRSQVEEAIVSVEVVGGWRDGAFSCRLCCMNSKSEAYMERRRPNDGAAMAKSKLYTGTEE